MGSKSQRGERRSSSVIVCGAMRALLPYFLLLPISNAIICRDWVLTPNHTTSADNDTCVYLHFFKAKYDNFSRTCEGDYCIMAGTQAEPIGVNFDFFSVFQSVILFQYQRCLSGPEFARFNGYCWANHAYSFCVCKYVFWNALGFPNRSSQFLAPIVAPMLENFRQRLQDIWSVETMK